MFICRSCARRASAALPRPVSSSCEAPSSASLGVLRTSSYSSFPAAARRSPQNGFAELDQVAALEKTTRDDDRSKVSKPTRGPKDEKRLAWVVRKHLEHMKDPFKIAEHVERTLKKDLFEEALELTRTASKDAQCQVSWNYLIDYQLRNQKLHGAIKLFNEVRSEHFSVLERATSLRLQRVRLTCRFR